MDLDRVDDLVEHWKDAPSVADCVRAYLGVRPRPVKSTQGPILVSDEELQQLLTINKAHAAMYGKAKA